MLHAGVDVMFTRASSDPYRAGGPNGSKMFVMPDSWPAVAASDGVLWSAGRSPRGYSVVIDHGNVATFYQHLETLLVPETVPKRGIPREQRLPIRAGQPLGVIGGDPLNAPHLKHLHFELWPSGPQSAIDPARIMAGWQVFSPADLAPYLAVRNAGARLTPKQDPRTHLIHVEAHTRRPAGSSLT
jgi:murein DD-endopeptidase MepM/ murein hydrolase activator NlpD